MTDSRRPTRSWILVLLALLLLIVPAAVIVQQAGQPTPPADVAEPGFEEAPEPEEPVFVAAPAPDAPAPNPAPAPKPATPETVQKIVDARRMAANQVAAVATCRNASSAQAQFQATAICDEDNDGTGEFGTFGEMSSGVPIRGSTNLMNPPVLSRAFKALDRTGRVERSGYVYAIFLPGPAGRPLTEQSGGGLGKGQVDADLAETTWCMYAWPKEHGVTGTFTYFVNQCGDVTRTDCSRYSGANGPAGDAAFKADPEDPTTRGTITGHVAIDAVGNDGNGWRQCN